MTTTSEATAETVAYESVNRSYGRCIRSDGFLDTFYGILGQSHPDLPPLFVNTDFTKQNQLVRGGLIMVIMFYRGASASRQAVELIRRSHSKSQLNIKPELYVYWVDALMEAVKRHDPEYTPELEEQWRMVIAPGINYIRDGYDTERYDL